MIKYNLKDAFTLAEVLITLGIIGVVAAITLPTLIANHREKETVSRIKKAYSTIQQAYIRAVDENGSPENWDLIDNRNPIGSTNMMNKLKPYLSITKTCVISDYSCWPKNIRYLNGTNLAFSDSEQKSTQAILSDGTMISVYVRDADCSENNGASKELSNVCGVFDIDINGKATPNQVGKDIFSFYITKYNIIPLGSQDDTDSFDRNCKKTSDGWGCAAWVLINENMDYLHCDGLNWTNKSKCN